MNHYTTHQFHKMADETYFVNKYQGGSMIDANEIIRALKLWFQAGDVFEVRVLDAVSADWMRPHTESGYFDYEHIPDAAAAIGKLRAYRGAYATVNPVKPELLARAWNRIRPVLKETDDRRFGSPCPTLAPDRLRSQTRLRRFQYQGRT